MRRFLPVVSLFVLMACQDKVICPAFQSTYILDDSVRNAYYSYVWQLDEATRNQYLAQAQNNGAQDSLGIDSLGSFTGNEPKTDYYAYAGEKVVPWRVRGRTKYGIVKYQPYWLTKYQMRTAPMENVYGPKKEEEKPDVNFVATSSTDSLLTDSTAVASNDLVTFDVAKVEEEKGPQYLYDFDPSDNFNVEQQYYIKHFGQRLIYEKPKQAPRPVQTVDSLSLANEADTLQRKGGLKGLFKKKRNKADTTTTATPVVEDADDE